MGEVGGSGMSLGSGDEQSSGLDMSGQGLWAPAAAAYAATSSPPREGWGEAGQRSGDEAGQAQQLQVQQLQVEQWSAPLRNSAWVEAAEALEREQQAQQQAQQQQ